jgi:hypothetical protein
MASRAVSWRTRTEQESTAGLSARATAPVASTTVYTYKTVNGEMEDASKISLFNLPHMLASITLSCRTSTENK